MFSWEKKAITKQIGIIHKSKLNQVDITYKIKFQVISNRLASLSLQKGYQDFMFDM